jgi:hypothetical protein
MKTLNKKTLDYIKSNTLYTDLYLEYLDLPASGIVSYQIIDETSKVYYNLDGDKITTKNVPYDIDNIIINKGTQINPLIYDFNKLYYVNIIYDEYLYSPIYLNDLQRTRIIKELNLFQFSSNKFLNHSITKIDTTTYNIIYDNTNLSANDQLFINFSFNQPFDKK